MRRRIPSPRIVTAVPALAWRGHTDRKQILEFF